MRPVGVHQKSIDMVGYDPELEQEVRGVAVRFRRYNHFLRWFKPGLLLNG